MLKKKKSLAKLLGLLVLSLLLCVPPAEARSPMMRASTKAINKAVQSTIRQAVKPTFGIVSRHAKRMATARFSADGRWLATANQDGVVYLWNLGTGQQMGVFRTEAGWISDLFFVQSGNVLAVATRRGELLAYDVNKLSLLYKIAAHNGAVIAMGDDEKGAVVTLGVDGHIKRWNGVSGQMLDERASGGSVLAGAIRKGGAIAALGREGGVIDLWDVGIGAVQRRLQCAASIRSLDIAPDGVLAAGLESGAVELWNTETGTQFMVRAGHSAAVAAVDISDDGALLASAGEDNNVFVSLLGESRPQPLQAHEDKVQSIHFSGDGRFVASASDDRTVRIWQREQQKEVARLVSMYDGWAVVSPDGGFDGTLDGEVEDRLDAVQWSAEGRVFPVDGFLESYYRPALLGRIFAKAETQPLRSVPFISTGFSLPPMVRISGEDLGRTISRQTTRITVEATDAGGGIDEIRLYHNGKLVDGSHAEEVASTGEEKEVKKLQYSVTLLDRENRFKALALSRDRIESEAVVALVTREVQVAAPLPVLHLVSIGINNYKNSALNLNFAVPDARDFTSYFRGKNSPLFREIKLYELYDKDATLAKISTTMEILQHVPPQDVVVLFLAGHGDTLRDRWYFIPHELTNPENDDALWNKGLSSSALQLMVARIGAGRILLLLDSCKSGTVLDAFAEYDTKRNFAVLSRSVGIHVGTSTTREQYAGELEILGHGLFTYVLLDGLGGSADTHPADGNVSVREILKFVEQGLPELVKKHHIPAQQPTVNSRGENFQLVSSGN